MRTCKYSQPGCTHFLKQADSWLLIGRMPFLYLLRQLEQCPYDVHKVLQKVLLHAYSACQDIVLMNVPVATQLNVAAAAVQQSCIRNTLHFIPHTAHLWV